MPQPHQSGQQNQKHCPLVLKPKPLSSHRLPGQLSRPLAECDILGAAIQLACRQIRDACLAEELAATRCASAPALRPPPVDEIAPRQPVRRHPLCAVRVAQSGARWGQLQHHPPRRKSVMIHRLSGEDGSSAPSPITMSEFGFANPLSIWPASNSRP